MSWGSKEVCSGCFFLDMIYLLDLDEGDDRLLPSWLGAHLWFAGICHRSWDVWVLQLVYPGTHGEVSKQP